MNTKSIRIYAFRRIRRERGYLKEQVERQGRGQKRQEWCVSQARVYFQESQVSTVKCNTIIGDNNCGFLVTGFDWKEVRGNLQENNFSNTGSTPLSHHKGELEN